MSWWWVPVGAAGAAAGVTWALQLYERHIRRIMLPYREPRWDMPGYVALMLMAAVVGFVVAIGWAHILLDGWGSL